MTRRFKWLIPILILCLVLMLVPCTGCTEGMPVYLLIYAGICGIQVTIDGEYQGELEWVEEWGACMLQFLWQEGESLLKFVIPGENIAQLASAHGMQLTASQASEMPDMTLKYQGVIAHDGRLEMNIYHPVALPTSPSVQNGDTPPLLGNIVVETSSEPLEPHPLIYPTISCEPSSFTVMLNPNTACSNTMRIGNGGDGTLTYELYDLGEATFHELVYDDNEADQGWGPPTGYRMAVRFTPSSYPVNLKTTRIRLWPKFSDSDHEQFAVEVYDDDGAGGAPGNLLGQVTTIATNWGWWDVDISGLGITITSGDFYIAYHPFTGYPEECEILCIDTDEPHFNRSWSKHGEYTWQQRSQNYMIRCVVEGGEDCPWLSENPKSGSVEPGNSDSITITIDASGLGPGDYSAEIIISNNDTEKNPTAVPVTLLVNNPPSTLSSPVPANHAANVPIDIDLSWTGGDPDDGDTVMYDVYLGTSSSPPLKDTIGPYPATQTSIAYGPGPLAYDTSYHWELVATDNHEVSAMGSAWDFTTGPPANNPPQLSSGNVEPSSGHPSTNFYYYVNYYDSDGDSPTVKYVRIDGTAYPMSLYSGSASNGVYRYGPKNLTAESHNYYFYFGDGKGGTARLPISGSYSGPSVSWGEFNPDFEANPREGEPPLEVQFDPTWTTGGALPYVKTEWDFNGDGIIDQTKSGGNTMDTVTYTYTSAAIYTISLTITDSCTPEPLVRTETKIDYITVIGEAASVSIDPPSRTVSPGSSCNIDVWVDAGDNNLRRIDVWVEYDSDAMTTTGGDVVGHNLLGGLQMGPEVTEAAGVGEVTYQVASVDAVAGVDASVMTITFTMDAAAEPGDYDLTITRGDLVDENAEPVVVGINDGTVTVVIGRKGDFDNDGDIDIFDFVPFAAAYGSELGDDNYNAIGDFDNNDCIDIYDFVNFAAVYGT